jgi:hypothetical protein
MTNCVYTRHQGKKTKQDVSFCLKTLQNITKDEWLSMCKTSGEKIGVKEEVQKATVVQKKKLVQKISVPSNEEMRALRTQYYKDM